MASHAETILSQIKYPRLTLHSITYLAEMRGYIEAGNDEYLKDHMNRLWMSFEWKAERPQ